MDNMVALSYLAKMGGTGNSTLVGLSKLSSVQTDHSYRRTSPGNSKCRSGFRITECKGLQRTETEGISLSTNMHKVGESTRNLFASRVSKQLPRYVSWKIDPYSIARDAFQINWG